MATIDPRRLSNVQINTAGSTANTISISGHAHTSGVYQLTPATFNVPMVDWVTEHPIVNRCAKDGHVMNPDVVEFEDGGIVGMCEQCGQIIKGRRVAGGMSLLKLRKALEDAVSGDHELVVDEYLKLAEEVDAEEVALTEARSLLRLAERALFARTPVSA